MALTVRIMPRALRQIHRAAQWWSENRPAAPGAIDLDLKEAPGGFLEVVAFWHASREQEPRV